MEGVENDLKAPYNDNDLVVLNSHLKKQEELEEDIAAHRDRLQELVVTAQQFQKEKHFLADELEEKVDELVQRCVSAWPALCQLFCSLNILFSFLLYFIPYQSVVLTGLSFKICRYKRLHDPLQERRGSLEASRLQYQFFRDVDEELAWVREKLPVASSKDYGKSLVTIQSLQEKHQVVSCDNHSKSSESNREH